MLSTDSKSATSIATVIATFAHASQVVRLRSVHFAVLISLNLVATDRAGLQAANTIDFTRDIRPILSDNCFFCHGPDEHERQADLRLDVEEAAKEVAVVPGDVERSELILRILSKDDAERMPPHDSGRQLSQAEIELLQQWVQQGAVWSGHWSWSTPQKPQLPALGSGTAKHWDQNPIDQFVLQQLRQQGLSPSQEADRGTLIRRVTLDLTGLPPSRAEVAAFVADDATDAYERVVDRLLGSAAYAERMTLAWMDAARYGDTSVMHADGPRDMWPWRDWVIDAYRKNKPFDEFLVEQLAGDLLPNATVSQRVATGFLRNNASSDEGGAFPEELRVEYVVDRVKTVFNVFQGLSAECAQCHSHKYDPISNEEYYGLFAFFNNAADPGMQTRAGNQPPIVRLHSKETVAFLAEKDRQINAAEQRLASEDPDPDEVNAWINASTDDEPAAHKVVSWHELSQPFVVEDLKKDWPQQPIDVEQPIWVGRPLAGGRSWQLRAAWQEQAKFLVQSKHSAINYLTVHLQATRRLAGEMRLQGGAAYQIWRDGELLEEVDFREDKRAVEVKFRVVLNRGSNRFLLKIASHDDQPLEHEWGFSPQPAAEAVRKLALKVSTWRRERQRAELVVAEPLRKNTRLPVASREMRQLAAHYKEHLWTTSVQLRRNIAALQAERKQREESSDSCMVMQDLPKVRPTYILERGQYDSPIKDREIEPDTPAALGSLGDAYPRNRLGLAQWMVSDKHPLTARVAVNRYWYLLFGRGLVDTVMDFGAQGSLPTHPELLDWLAVDFRESGWDVKRALKQMVLSQTYRQSAALSSQLKLADPENQYLARAGRFRLQGDFIRDQALAVSGLLVRKVGGPSVKPYQPAGLWNEVSLNKGLFFQQDHGEALYRRSLYIYWKRSAPPPSMQIFDAPTREKCTVSRPRTNTPLQALVTLNDVQFVEASRKLAERIMKEGGKGFDERLNYGYQLCTARLPRERELEICRSVYEAQFASFAQDPARARQYLDHGEANHDDSLPPVEHATWTVLANMLLNLDEVLMRN